MSGNHLVLCLAYTNLSLCSGSFSLRRHCILNPRSPALASQAAETLGPSHPLLPGLPLIALWSNVRETFFLLTLSFLIFYNCTPFTPQSTLRPSMAHTTQTVVSSVAKKATWLLQRLHVRVSHPTQFILGRVQNKTTSLILSFQERKACIDTIGSKALVRTKQPPGTGQVKQNGLRRRMESYDQPKWGNRKREFSEINNILSFE